MAISASLKKKLAAASKKFQKTTAAASTGMVNENVEDGNYTADLVAAEIVEQNAKAAVIFTYDLRIEEGTTEQVKSRYWLETDQNLAFLKRDLGRFGLTGLDELDLAADLDGLLARLIELKPVCRVSVKTSDQWQNVYLNKVMEISDEPGDEENDDEGGIGVGSNVTYKDKEYVVDAVDEETETCTLKGNGKKISKVKLSAVALVEEVEEETAEEEAVEEEAVEEAEELAELEVGSAVSVTWKGKVEPGKVKAIDEENEKADVFLTKLKKTVKVAVDKIELNG